jgi:hypothetical protein
MSTETASAAERVPLLLPELLEQILLLLPTKAICRVPRVCKTWNAVIDTRQALKVAMFLLVHPDDRPAWDSARDIIINPILSDLLSPKIAELESPHPRYHLLKTGSWARPQASWRKRLLTKQPISHIHVDCHWVDPAGIGTINSDQFPFGLEQMTLGRLWENVWRYMREPRSEGAGWRKIATDVSCFLWGWGWGVDVRTAFGWGGEGAEFWLRLLGTGTGSASGIVWGEEESKTTRNCVRLGNIPVWHVKVDCATGPCFACGRL